MEGETLLNRGGGADAYLYAESLATQTSLWGRIRGVDVWCLTGVCILHRLNEVCSSMRVGEEALGEPWTLLGYFALSSKYISYNFYFLGKNLSIGYQKVGYLL